MPRRRKIVVALSLALLGAALLAGCGGSGSSASSSTPVSRLLHQTFSGNKHVTSGKFSLAVAVTPMQGSPVSLQLGGPFESQGKGKLPKFAINLAAHGSGQDFSAGVTSVGNKGFVSFQGKNYAVSNQIFQQFKKGYEQSQAQAASKHRQSLTSLGIDPQRWLTHPRNAGEAQVGGTDTIKITGGVDVPKLLDDVNTLLQRTRSLGGSAAARIPQQLTPQERQQAAKAVKHLSVEIYTGKDDKILRRIVIAASVQAPQGSGTAAGQSANIKVDAQITDVNQSQSISAPPNAKPFSQLLSGLGGLGGLGSSSGSGSGSSSGPSAGTLKKYSRCIKKAGTNAKKARKCANLLGP